MLDVCVPLHLLSLPGQVTLGLHVPFIEAHFSDIAWKSRTKAQTLDDDVVRTAIAHDEASLTSFASQHGSLDIGPQSRQGVGDVAVMLNWLAHFSQYQRRLQDVRVTLRGGISFPTGHQVDTNKSFDIDFGHDGAVCVPLGAGLRLTLEVASGLVLMLVQLLLCVEPSSGVLRQAGHEHSIFSLIPAGDS